MSKALALTFVLVFLILTASCVVYIRPVKAQYQGNISINGDGSVGPSSAAPIVKNGDTYTLTSDIKGTISITKSNITFNGNGHTINQYAVTQDSSNAFGIFLSNVYNVTVANTRIINTGNGIYVIQNPTAGINIENGGSNTIIRNNIVNNYHAINFLESNNNLLVENNITSNYSPLSFSWAVMFWGSSSNKVYHNNFIDNQIQVGLRSFNSPSQNNKFDNGVEGNFWDDYNGTDANGDGIGDTPYQVETRNVDNYPLVEPFNSTLYSLKTTPPTISLLSPTEQTFNESDVPLTFLVDNAVNWSGYVLDKAENFTLSGNTTLTGLANGLHNVTVYAQDTYGNIGTSQTTNFTVAKPEPLQPFPIVPVAVASIVLVAVIVAAGLLVYFKRRRSEAL